MLDNHLIVCVYDVDKSEDLLCGFEISGDVVKVRSCVEFSSDFVKKLNSVLPSLCILFQDIVNEIDKKF